LIIQSATSTNEVFQAQVDMARNITEKFLDNDKIRVGLVVDSFRPRSMQSLDSKKSNLFQVLDSLRKQDGSDLPQALRISSNELKNANDQTKKLNLVVMLDEKLSIESMNVLNKMKEEGVKIYFGVFGNKLKENDVKKLKDSGEVVFPSSNNEVNIVGMLGGMLFSLFIIYNFF